MVTGLDDIVEMVFKEKGKERREEQRNSYRKQKADSRFLKLGF